MLKHSLFSTSGVRLPAVFNRLAWSNLAAQSAEQIGLAATPIIAVLAFGAGAGETGLLQTMYVPYAVHKLGLSASGVGATLAAYGIGMASAALLAPSAMRRLPFGIAVTIGPIAGLAASTIMALTIWLPSSRLAWFSYFLFGSGPVLWTIGSTTLRQVVTPEALLGRVSAINTTATYGSRPLGAALGALVGAAYGAEACLLVAAFGFMTQALVILASPVPQLARQPEPTACSELRI